MKQLFQKTLRWLAVTALLLLMVQSAAADTGGTTELVSQTTTGQHADVNSSLATVSKDGSRVVFSSEESAADLVAGAQDSNDTSGGGLRWDVFLRVRSGTPATYVISRYRENLDGWQSFLGAISAGGEFAVFQSDASDIDFVHPCGSTDPTTSAGIFQIYLADLRDPGDIQLYLVSRRRTVTTNPDSCTWEEGDAASGKISISQGGTYFPAAVNRVGDNVEVVFQSQASNLISESNGGGQDLYYYRANIDQLEAGSLGIVSVPAFMMEDLFKSGYFRSPALSADGLTVAMVLGSQADQSDGQVYLLDRDIDSDGITDDQDLDMNDDGSVDGSSPNDPFLPPGYILVSKNFETDEPGNGPSSTPALSLDLSSVVFASKATNLLVDLNGVPDNNNGRDVFRYDVRAQQITLLSLNSTATAAANGESYFPSISSVEGLIVFQSAASDMTVSDSDGWPDVFLYREGILPASANDIVLLSTNNDGQNSNWHSALPRISRDGSTVVFTDYSTNMPNASSTAPTVGNIYARLLAHDPPIDTAPHPEMAVSPANWYFGFVGEDGTDKKVIRVTNVGDADLVLTSITPFAPESPFSFLTGEVGSSLSNCISLMNPDVPGGPLKPVLLQPMQSCYIHLQYVVETWDEGYDKTFHGIALTINSNDPEKTTFSMNLAGGYSFYYHFPIFQRHVN